MLIDSMMMMVNDVRGWFTSNWLGIVTAYDVQYLGRCYMSVHSELNLAVNY